MTLLSELNYLTKDLGREEWLEAPTCIKCFVSMDLNEGCEWPDDNRALMCAACLCVSFERALQEIKDSNRKCRRKK